MNYNYYFINSQLFLVYVSGQLHRFFTHFTTVVAEIVVAEIVVAVIVVAEIVVAEIVVAEIVVAEIAVAEIVVAQNVGKQMRRNIDASEHNGYPRFWTISKFSKITTRGTLV